MSLRIGISVVTHSGQNIWENGLGQNVVFLIDTFRHLSFVSSVVLIDVGDQGVLPPQVDMGTLNLPIMRPEQATDAVDVVVEMGGALEVRWLDLMRARGRKVVYLCCGQPFVGMVEPAVFERPAGCTSRPDRCDEIWLLPKDECFAPMMRTMHRCPVYVVPYLWDSRFVDARNSELAGEGKHFGYVPLNQRIPKEGDAQAPAPTGWRVGIFEPNISVVKASTIPMLICDEAYRAERASITAMHVLNTLHMVEHPTLLYLGNSLDLVREHRATFHGRFDVAGFMADNADAVVSHQWQNDQNNLPLDILHGGYPLIHNSRWLRDVGYYYPDFEVGEGARQFLHALHHHDGALDDYNARSKRMLDSLHPVAPANLQAYADRLLQLKVEQRVQG